MIFVLNIKQKKIFLTNLPSNIMQYYFLKEVWSSLSDEILAKTLQSEISFVMISINSIKDNLEVDFIIELLSTTRY